MDPLNVAPDAMERAEELIDLEALRGVIAAALERLRPAERQAVVAYVLDGKSYTEAAQTAGCTEQAVRARVSRALKRLAAQLDVLGEDQDLSLIHISEPTRLGMISYAVFCLK